MAVGVEAGTTTISSEKSRVSETTWKGNKIKKGCQQQRGHEEEKRRTEKQKREESHRITINKIRKSDWVIMFGENVSDN